MGMFDWFNSPASMPTGGGLFGSGGQAGQGMDQVSKLQVLGAMLQDMGANLDGRTPGALNAVQGRIKRLGDQKQYQDTLGMLFAGPQPTMTQQPVINSRPDGSIASATAGQVDFSAPGALAGQANTLQPILAGMDPEKGLGLAATLMTQKPEIGTPREGINPQTGKPGQYVLGQNNEITWLDVAAPMKAPTSRTIRQGMQDITQEFDPMSGQWREIAKGAAFKPEAPRGDDVGGGKTVDERMINTLIKGDPLSPEYAAAYGFLAKPRATINPETGQLVTIKQDLSWARSPMRNGQGQPAQPVAYVGDQIVTPKQTQEQKLAAGFASRMAEANKALEGRELALADPVNTAISKAPLMGNYLVSGPFQLASQAKANWINAQLRRESGAVIGPHEFSNADAQYFPVPGDTEATLKQKRQNRKTAEAAMRNGSTNEILSKPKTPDGNQLPTKNIGGKTYVQRNGQWFEQ